MRKVIAAFVMLSALLMVGCASVPMASLDADTKAKEFTALPGKAALYVYRNETLGGAIPMSVGVNGKILGQTGPQTYFHLNLVPGLYEVDSHAENISKISLSAEAGKAYFVWQEIKMGMWMARSSLQQVDEETGRKGVMESKMAALSAQANDIPPLATPVASAPVGPSTPGGSSDPIANKIRELQALKKDGLISEDEYQAKKTELLKKM